MGDYLLKGHGSFLTVFEILSHIFIRVHNNVTDPHANTLAHELVLIVLRHGVADGNRDGLTKIIMDKLIKMACRDVVSDVTLLRQFLNLDSSKYYKGGKFSYVFEAINFGTRVLSEIKSPANHIELLTQWGAWYRNRVSGVQHSSQISSSSTTAQETCEAKTMEESHQSSNKNTDQESESTIAQETTNEISSSKDDQLINENQSQILQDATQVEKSNDIETAETNANQLLPPAENSNDIEMASVNETDMEEQNGNGMQVTDLMQSTNAKEMIPEPQSEISNDIEMTLVNETSTEVTNANEKTLMVDDVKQTDGNTKSEYNENEWTTESEGKDVFKSENESRVQSDAQPQIPVTNIEPSKTTGLDKNKTNVPEVYDAKAKTESTQKHEVVTTQSQLSELEANRIKVC